MSTTITPVTTLADELALLVPVALHGLSQMQDNRIGLFSHKALVGPDGKLTNHGINPLYTAACVIGLQSVRAGRTEPYAGQTRKALSALVRVDANDPAVIGATLWGCVAAGRAEATRLADALVARARPLQWSSMQLGLALAGLSRSVRAGVAQSRRATCAARAMAEELERRYVSQARVFAATSGRRRDPFGMTSFASQVYPVLGLCELAEATATEPPAAVKRVCDFLVRSQGKLGQWWWFYSTRAPKVIEGYPVYSVHQDAMAVMALLPATWLGIGDYREALTSGVQWINGTNELGQSMVNRRAGVIYRSVQRTGGDADGFAGWSRGQRAAAYRAGLTGRTRRAPEVLEVLEECRSYHLGWLLLAAAMAGAA